MANSFEKVMSACLENKKATTGTAKKATKKLTEGFTMDGDYDPELSDTVDDIDDNIVVVVDPNKSEDEFSQAAEDAQAIVDAAPEGETPKSDEYIDDLTLTCPICGQNFFSEKELSEGDECPVCGETPTNFVLLGKVAEADNSEEIDSAKESDEVANPDDFDDDGEKLEPDEKENEGSDEDKAEDKAEDEDKVEEKIIAARQRARALRAAKEARTAKTEKTQKPIQKTAKAAELDKIAENRKARQEALKKASKAIAERRQAQATQKPVVENKPIQRPVQKTVERTIQRPVRPITKTVEKVVAPKVERPISKTVQRPVQRPVEKVERPIQKTAQRPVRPIQKPIANKAVESTPIKRERTLFLDESTFNPFLNRFITENYSNAKSFVVIGAKTNGRTLSLECKVTFKSGKSKAIVLKSEGFKANGEYTLTAHDDGAFKNESKKTAPFVFTVSAKNGVIRCEGLKYSITTKAIKENKKVLVSGNLVKESAVKKPVAPVKTERQIGRPIQRPIKK